MHFNNSTNNEQSAISKLMDIMRRLMGPDGCPWDQVQTHESIRKNLIEEAYEAVDAIDAKDSEKIKDELGDVLLQVVFHAVIAEQSGEFDLDDIAENLSQKLITRHSHVFGQDQADSPDEVLSVWDKNKMKEKGQQTFAETLLDVPCGLPALMRSEKLQKRAAKARFDWPDAHGALEKIFEEIEEVRQVYHLAQREPFSKINNSADVSLYSKIENEVGDFLFAAVNFSRLMGIDPEVALNRANNKFVNRFSNMEKMAEKERRLLKEMSLEEMDKYWEKAKSIEHEN